MSVKYTRASTIKELEEILELQKQNLPNQLTKQEIEKEGFLTISHTLDLLTRMNAMYPHIIAKSKNKVVGYALCMHPSFSKEIPVIQSMFKEIRQFLSKDESFMVMGQICVDKEYRGQGIFRGLYAAMKNAVSGNFNYIITEVDSTNIRSLNAHYAVGFTLLKTYSADDKIWKLITIKTL
jgi:ribosomal protein S18 acetylase RimI-like enzyme